MRRKDLEITDMKEIEAILNQAFVCHLGLVYEDTPYVVPLNYAYHNGAVYIHSANVGRKINLIRENNTVCFQMEIYNPEIRKPSDKACDFGTSYKSVIGIGKAVILTDNEEKTEGLKAILKRFDPRDFKFSDEDLDLTTVIRIDITELSAKKSRL